MALCKSLPSDNGKHSKDSTKSLLNQQEEACNEQNEYASAHANCPPSTSLSGPSSKTSQQPQDTSRSGANITFNLDSLGVSSSKPAQLPPTPITPDNHQTTPSTQPCSLSQLVESCFHAASRQDHEKAESSHLLSCMSQLKPTFGAMATGNSHRGDQNHNTGESCQHSTLMESNFRAASHQDKAWSPKRCVPSSSAGAKSAVPPAATAKQSTDPCNPSTSIQGAFQTPAAAQQLTIHNHKRKQNEDPCNPSTSIQVTFHTPAAAQQQTVQNHKSKQIEEPCNPSTPVEGTFHTASCQDQERRHKRKRSYQQMPCNRNGAWHGTRPCEGCTVAMRLLSESKAAEDLMKAHLSVLEAEHMLMAGQLKAYAELMTRLRALLPVVPIPTPPPLPPLAQAVLANGCRPTCPNPTVFMNPALHAPAAAVNSILQQSLQQQQQHAALGGHKPDQNASSGLPAIRTDYPTLIQQVLAAKHDNMSARQIQWEGKARLVSALQLPMLQHQAMHQAVGNIPPANGRTINGMFPTPAFPSVPAYVHNAWVREQCREHEMNAELYTKKAKKEDVLETSPQESAQSCSPSRCQSDKDTATPLQPSCDGEQDQSSGDFHDQCRGLQKRNDAVDPEEVSSKIRKQARRQTAAGKSGRRKESAVLVLCGRKYVKRVESLRHQLQMAAVENLKLQAELKKTRLAAL